MTATRGIHINARVSSDGGTLELQGVVNDAEVRAQAPGFDGLEGVFARVPRRNGLQTEWYDVPLGYRLTYSAGHGLTRTLDVHEAAVGSPDLAALASHGVAVGIRTNVGTLWAQELGANAVVSVPFVPGPTPPEGIFVQATAFSGDQGLPSVRIQVAVEDAKLRERMPGFNGLEQVCARVPRYVGTTMIWDEIPLGFVTNLATRMRSVDVHELSVTNIDVRAVKDAGIALVVRTNCGEVWAQPPHQNYPVSGISSF